MIKYVELYVNDTKSEALETSQKVRKELQSFGYVIIDSPTQIPDLVIGIGGDGTLLEWLRSRKYHTTTVKYIGINCGTVGFMQNFDVTDAKEFVANIPSYVEEKLHFVFLELVTKQRTSHYLSLNEFYISEGGNQSLKPRVKVDGKVLEDYVGSALLFCSPTGSTARNLSANGTIIFPGVEAYQMTPCEAAKNGKVHCLSNPICLPTFATTTLNPINDKDEIKVLVDNKEVYKGEYLQIRIGYSDLYMATLRHPSYSFARTVNKKLI